MGAKPSASVLAYYQDNKFNPVLIRVEEDAVWAQHVAKRRNLVERHLGIPLSLLRGQRVLEFGPNSGENALVLAQAGARLTLVEPNDQVFPRLHALFEKFGVAGQLDALHCAGIDDFVADQPFDFVIAEGFLYTLPNRDDLLRRLTTFVAPGKFGAISSNDLHGGLIELLRRAVLFRACRAAGIDDEHSDAGLDLARTLFLRDFRRLNSSRTFEAWWKDTLVNPFYATEYLWSYPTLFRVLEDAGCDLHGCSPVWSTGEHHNWYKNVPTPAARWAVARRDWRNNLVYFITGLAPSGRHRLPVDEEVADAIAGLASALSDAGRTTAPPARTPDYPIALDRHLAECPDPLVRVVNGELKTLVAALDADDADALVRAYHGATTVRSLWGTAYHYVSFTRGG